MGTMWKNESGDWVLTNLETPLCISCMIPTMQLEDGRVLPLRMQADTQKLVATCPTCGKEMYREVS